MKTYLYCLLALATLQLPNLAAKDLNKPNIILILCDDLGYGDVGLYGPEIQKTPNIQKLASEGLVLTNFYVSSGVCTPSRSSIMTGCYPRRTRMHRDSKGRWVLFPVASKGLNPEEITVAELLKNQGYATSIIGKWHLGDQPPFLPTRQGFDHWFGLPYSNDMSPDFRPKAKHPPLPLMRDETLVETNPDQTYLTARYTKEAVAFIEENKDRSFFLYFPHAMPHLPVAATENFRGKSANGKYGDAVEEIDWSLGQIVDALKRQGIEQNTLLVFTSDNGAEAHEEKSNLPLRGHKGTTLEGGMRVPFVAYWPGTIPKGIRSDELTTSMDFLPTFAALTGASLPEDRIIDGHDITDILLGTPGASSPYDAFYYYYSEQLQAVRSGEWKLQLARSGNWREPEQIEQKLFNLQEDPQELRDLSASHPEIVERLQTLTYSIRNDIGDRGKKGENQRAPGKVPNPVPLAPAPEK